MPDGIREIGKIAPPRGGVDISQAIAEAGRPRWAEQIAAVTGKLGKRIVGAEEEKIRREQKTVVAQAELQREIELATRKGEIERGIEIEKIKQKATGERGMSSEEMSQSYGLPIERTRPLEDLPMAEQGKALRGIMAEGGRQERAQSVQDYRSESLRLRGEIAEANRMFKRQTSLIDKKATLSRMKEKMDAYDQNVSWAEEQLAIHGPDIPFIPSKLYEDARQRDEFRVLYQSLEGDVRRMEAAIGEAARGKPEKVKPDEDSPDRIKGDVLSGKITDEEAASRYSKWLAGQQQRAQ